MIALVTQVLIGVAMAMLLAAAVLALYRLGIGPTNLDRVVATDVVVAVLIAAIAGHSVVTATTTGLPILLVLSLVAFTGSVGVARLTSSTRERDRRFQEIESHAHDDQNAEGV
ncbi:monovalent cation/H+ antiporter complex subunit F [Nigerium massiliense]|uniref:monovalent cation/H+ antiporter complex subunit F n=1 Tax=Nigerium massiliense TaxID=1522317 RepID=UPI00069404BE|nr:monovalent cation/H+ antiporter complex subunit F [Nigerium massiliense]